MLRSKMTAAILVGMTALALAAPAKAEPLMGVYKGAGCEGAGRLPRYEGVVGRKLDSVTDFFAANSWPSLLSSANWALGCWQGKPYKMMIGIPLTVNGTPLADVAAGKQDEQFRKLGAMLVAKGQANAILRLGWEFNGGWYPWSAGKDPSSLKPAFRHVVGVLRATPGQHFQIAWNPSLGAGVSPPETFWPGDDVVDVIGLDIYNQSWRKQDADPQTRWRGYLTANYGLNWLGSFAPAHGKPIVIPEWGTGTRPDGHGWGDDPLFIHNMAAWMRAHNVIAQNYWDFTASDYDATMSAGKFPRALAAYQAEFGGRRGHGH